MSDMLREVGERIKERRKRMYFTQEGLAAEIDVTSQTISSAEHGTKELRIENFAMICQALETSADYLLFGRKASNREQFLFMEKVSRLPQEQFYHLENIINSFIAALEIQKEEEPMA